MQRQERMQAKSCNFTTDMNTLERTKIKQRKENFDCRVCNQSISQSQRQSKSPKGKSALTTSTWYKIQFHQPLDLGKSEPVNHLLGTYVHITWCVKHGVDQDYQKIANKPPRVTFYTKKTTHFKRKVIHISTKGGTEYKTVVTNIAITIQELNLTLFIERWLKFRVIYETKFNFN